jgi:hypothetical protein
MKYIKKFKSDDFITESMILESTIYYSPKFREKIQRVLDIYGSGIAYKLLNKEGEDIKKDWTLIDSKEDSDDISFINMKNANKLLKKAGYESELDDHYIDDIWNLDVSTSEIGISSKSRNNIKIGKFVKGLFGNYYTDTQIEKFVNQFKSIKEPGQMEFKLVSGDEISKWYNPINSKHAGRGTLGRSCMAYSDKDNFFSIYTKNPEVCKLLILLEDGKLIGRSLIWKLNSIEAFYWDYEDGYVKNKSLTKEMSKIEYFMDRIYTSEDYLVNNFINYAKSEGWLLRSQESIHDPNTVTFRSKDVHVEMTVKVKKVNYEPYPYLDTFKRYNHFNGTLNNDTTKKKGGHILRSTRGGYESSISKSKYYINRFKDLFY